MVTEAEKGIGNAAGFEGKGQDQRPRNAVILNKLDKAENGF